MRVAITRAARSLMVDTVSGSRVLAPRALSSLSEPAFLTRPYKDIPASIGDKGTAQDAWEKSCYYKVGEWCLPHAEGFPVPAYGRVFR
jgi:hypothetical protein